MLLFTVQHAQTAVIFYSDIFILLLVLLLCQVLVAAKKTRFLLFDKVSEFVIQT